MGDLGKKRVLILGATGMLGSALYGVLKDKYDLILAVRDRRKITLLEEAYGNVDGHQIIEFDAAHWYEAFIKKEWGPASLGDLFLDSAKEIDYVINAIGITTPSALHDKAMTLFVNGALPRILAGFLGAKLIHITTDCAYDGKKGYPYDERSIKTPVDLYGLSKSIGEPVECLTLRTSIIGRELEGFSGLLEWFLHQKGRTVTGFAGHFWNGVTTKQFAMICDQIMREPGRFPAKGLFHIFSSTVSKYDMLVQFKEKYGVQCEIKKDGTEKLNRTLATVFDFQKKLNIPPFEVMLKDL